MSEENRIQTEEELWDVLNEPVVAEGKSRAATKTAPKPKPAPVPTSAPEAKPKTVGRFARPEPEDYKEEEPVAPAAVPGKDSISRVVTMCDPEPVAPAAVPGKKLDGFFFACMAGVAAVSVAATLIVSSMVGGEKPAAPIETDPGISGEIISTEAPIQTDPGLAEEIARLELENAELQAQLMQQRQQVQNLQAEIMALTGGEQVMATSPSGDSGGSNEAVNAQVEAYGIFTKIQDAYANFDRAKLEELIPEMDKRLSYLSSEDLNEYYLILEYVEQPSNG